MFSPSRLPAVEQLGGCEVLKVLMVGIDGCLMLGPLQVMPPLLESTHYRQHFLIIDLIVQLGRCKHLR
jgi:hypothetical protein